MGLLHMESKYFAVFSQNFVHFGQNNTPFTCVCTKQYSRSVELIFCVHLSSSGHISLDYDMRNITKYEGEMVRIRCEITGDPIPQYWWFKNDSPLDDLEADIDSGRISYKTTHWGSRSVQWGQGQ